MLYRVKYFFFRRKYRRKNRHNETTAINIFNMKNVEVGKHTYGGIYCILYSRKERLKIGNFVSIAPNVSFLLGADHGLNTLSTFPYKTKIVSGEYEALSKGDIVVDDDVWIGQGAMILSGVHIGQGAVVAAGAVVNKDVPPYAVVGGVPARVIKYRFGKDVIEFFRMLDYSRLTEDMIKEHEPELYLTIESMPVEDIKNLYSWFPQKEKLLD